MSQFANCFVTWMRASKSRVVALGGKETAGLELGLGGKIWGCLGCCTI